MKRTLIPCAMAAALSLVAAGAHAQSHGGHGGGGFHGGGGHGFHGGGGHGFHGGHSFHGGRFHGHGFRGFGTSVFIGAPLWWPYYGYPYYYDYPAYTYYDYPTEVYVEPGTSSPQPQPQPQPQAQFYCPDTGYYPTVKTCPQGWLRVLPGNPTPQY